MPLYMYRCEACQTHFEVRKPMAEANSKAPCPECESGETHKLISTIAVFSSSGNGQVRAIAGGSPCSACSAAGPACATCHPR